MTLGVENEDNWVYWEDFMIFFLLKGFGPVFAMSTSFQKPL